MDFKGILSFLPDHPRVWLITGVAGFIGSNLLEALLKLDQSVIGIDNLSTGKIENIEAVRRVITANQWNNFEFIKGDICDYSLMSDLCKRADIVLHQAALGSVPRSLEDPINSNLSNVTGFLNVLRASQTNNVKRLVYAASSSTYGDSQILPKSEAVIGSPLSPYAVTKLVNELYSDVFSSCFDFHSIGLRYFNVFGPRQDPFGPYAAVIPRWIEGMIKGDDIFINGDGSTSRDFCYIQNVVQANLLAALSNNICCSRVYNVAVGDSTNLLNLFNLIRVNLRNKGFDYQKNVIFKDWRKGDVRHSLADISRIKDELLYCPHYDVNRGLGLTVDWFVEKNS